MTDYVLSRVLLALIVLLVSAHLVGGLFARIRQPRAIGEIVGGLLVGPTVLGRLAPGAERWLFDPHGPTAPALGIMTQLGLLLLMFCSGMEIRSLLDRAQGALVGMLAGIGIALPFAAGLALLAVVDLRSSWGPAGTPLSFGLVFAVAIAVTSIPVISRIMFDLGIIGTPFARIVLGVAVLEDIVLYVVLAIALGAASTPRSRIGLPEALGFQPGAAADVAYRTVVTLGVLGVLLAVAALRARRGGRRRGIPLGAPVGARLVLLLVVTVVCLLLGIEPFLGALAAGIAVSASRPARTGAPTSTGVGPGVGTSAGTGADDANQAIIRFSFAFFVPVYFASVGVALDLGRSFDVAFFLGLLVFACAAKAASVYLAARLARTSRSRAVNLAIALNARGGPGIVLASVAYQAGVVDQNFYACLVLLAVVTSLLAGAWLERQPDTAFTDGELALASPGRGATRTE
jgi:Kef-type K+ transport system membrane component KefB